MADGPAAEESQLIQSETEGESEDPRLFQFSCRAGTDEELIGQAIMTGNIAAIVEFCQRTGNWADALVLSQLGDRYLFEQVQSAYFEHKRDLPVIRMARAVALGNLSGIAMYSDLASWKETLSILLTYSKPNELPRLTGILGNRLVKKGNQCSKMRKGDCLTHFFRKPQRCLPLFHL